MSIDLAFLLTRVAQQVLWDEEVPGAVEAAAAAVLATDEPLVRLGPQVIEAALAAAEIGPLAKRLAGALMAQLADDQSDEDAPSAARALGAFVRRQGGEVPAALSELASRESAANVDVSHSIARLRDRERLLGQLRRELRANPELSRQLVSLVNGRPHRD